MASLSHDSELMTQHVAAVAVPNSSRFVTVNDELGNPMVFSLGTDQKLRLIKINRAGERVLIDFGALLRLVDHYKVYAFDVAQDVDSTLYVILATQDQASGSDLIVLRPFKPIDYDLSEYSTDLRVLKMPQKGTLAKTDVKSIYISNSNTGQDYPLVLFAFQPLDQINTTQDLARLVVHSLDGWTIEHDLSLPENAFKMVALQPLNLPFRGMPSLPGFIALYEIQEKLQLIFVSVEKLNNTYLKVSLTCPPGAGTLSSFINASGFTDLIVGGEGLYHFQAAECLKKSAEGRKVSGDGVFSSVRQVYVTRSIAQLSVWAANTADGIGYLTAGVSLTDPGAPVQVIPDSQGGMFSPFKPTTGGPEQFIVANSKGVLSLLQQDSAMGLWKTVPFFTPALETTVEIPSYTTQITIKGSDKMPLVDSKVMLKSSGLVSIIANGRQIVTGPVGVPVKTDEYGLITLIIPTRDISSHTFTVTGATGGELEGKSFTVDPTEKVNAVLDKIHSGTDLTDIELPSGEKLLKETKLKPEEIERVANAIEAVQNARKDIVKEKAPRRKQLRAVEQRPSPAPQLNSLIGFQTEKLAQSGSGFMDMAWDAWHWLENVATEVTSWAITKTEQGTAFVIQLGDKFYRWVLDGLTETGKALSWIFDKVLEIGAKVIEWLGFIFNWKDIQATQKSIVHLTNDALTSGLGYIDGLESKVDGFFGDMKKHVEKESGKPRPDEINDVAANSESGEHLPDHSNSAKANWAQYQFSHGGGVDASVIHGEQGESEPLGALWTKVVQPLYETLRNWVENLALTISNLFFSGNNKSLSVQQAMAKMETRVLLALLDDIQKIAVGLVKVAKSLINEFKEFMNYKITIPVFSAIYKEYISGGADLTLLDGLSMILAIPITIITKAITGKTPPDMTKVKYGEIIDGKVTDPQQLLDFNHFNSVSSLVGSGLDGFISNVSMVASPSALTSKIDKTDMAMFAMTKAVSAKGVTDIAKKSWKDVFGVAARVASIPTDPSQPAYGLRWISWVLSCISTGISIALRRVTTEVSGVIEKALAVIHGALASINYALVVAVKAIEFQTSSFPGKNNTYTLLKLVSGTFDLLATLSDDVGHLAVDPETKGWAGVCSLSAQVLSYNIEGGVIAVKLLHGDYNDIISKVM